MTIYQKIRRNETKKWIFMWKVRSNLSKKIRKWLFAQKIRMNETKNKEEL